MGYRILAIHHSPVLDSLLEECARASNYELKTLRTGSQGLQGLLEERPDLIVVDMALPDIDGLVWLKILRDTKEGGTVPVMVVSDRSVEEGMAQAFNLGADDFVCYKGLDPRELSARLRAVLRRRHEREELLSDALELGPIRLDPGRHECRVRGRRRTLRPREFEFLEVIMRKAGRVLSRPYLLESVWGMSRFADTRTVDVTVSRLRGALGKRAGSWVETIERFGYRFRDPAESSR